MNQHGVGSQGDCSTASACYIYYANGQRADKYMTNGSSVYYHIYDTGGNVLSDTDKNGNWNETYFRLGGQLIGLYRGSWTGFLAKDHLGSTRLDTLYVPSGTTPPSGCTVPSGTTYCVYDNMDYLPFGEQALGGHGTTDQFTSDQYDAEDGLYDTPARKYSPTIGRWMTPDPANLAAADPTTPQSWNRYTYVLNNPLEFLDPLGLFPYVVCTTSSVSTGFPDDNGSTIGIVSGPTQTDCTTWDTDIIQGALAPNFQPLPPIKGDPNKVFTAPPPKPSLFAKLVCAASAPLMVQAALNGNTQMAGGGVSGGIGAGTGLSGTATAQLAGDQWGNAGIVLSGSGNPSAFSLVSLGAVAGATVSTSTASVDQQSGFFASQSAGYGPVQASTSVSASGVTDSAIVGWGLLGRGNVENHTVPQKL